MEKGLGSARTAPGVATADRGRMMAWPVAVVNLTLLAATGFGAPVPSVAGTWELVLVAALATTTLLVAGGIATGRARIRGRDQLVPLLLLPAFALPVVASLVMAAFHGTPADVAARSALPYLAFLPVALLGLISGRTPRPAIITGPLLLAGLGQSLYLLGLFLLRVPDPTDPRSVWLARITLLDPRTTLPMFLAAAILPLAAIAATRKPLSRIFWLVPIGLAVGAALSTQTRSQLIALAAGSATFGVVNGFWRARQRGRSWYRGIVRSGALVLTGLVVTAALLYAIPQSRALLQAVVLRSQTDLDTGRIDDEWIPAINTVLADGVPGLLAGVGSGQSFITGGGEERTYVHNLVLYSLVYFGAVGLCLVLLGYVLLTVGLWRRGSRTGDQRYFALAALVVALFVYAQFFAVHKLFSYNLMLMLAAQALLQPPAPRSDNR